MVKQTELLSLIGLPYRYNNGPPNKDIIDPHKDGINCQLLTHQVLYTLFGVSLPPEVMSKEIYENISLFKEVDIESGLLTRIKLGDIFLFCYPGESDFRRLHPAVYIDEQEKDTNDPLLIHATVIAGESTIWPLTRFFNYTRYQELYGVRRLLTIDDYKL